MPLSLYCPFLTPFAQNLVLVSHMTMASICPDLQSDFTEEELDDIVNQILSDSDGLVQGGQAVGGDGSSSDDGTAL